MRILLYEHICATLGGKPPEATADSLHREGWAMRTAVAADLARIPGVHLTTLDTADRLTFVDAARQSDFTLVIAPECDGILADRCAMVEQCGGRLLGPSAAAVRLAGDKLALAEHWQRHGVPTPPSWLLLPGNPPHHILPPAVCKPRHGAGAQATFLLEDATAWPAVLASAQAEWPDAEMLVQPFASGLAASVAWLVGPAQQLPLMPARQDLSADGRFHYRGGQLPLDAHLVDRAITLSRRAIACVPGLLGYVGVDLVLGAASDGREDVAIELNPRLTTSYVGLRALAKDNLAAVMLQLAAGDPVPALNWHPGTVHFTADGTTRHRP